MENREKMYKIDGMITVDDLLDYNKYYYKSTLNTVKNKVLLSIFVVIVFILAFYDVSRLMDGKIDIYEMKSIYIILYLILFVLIVKHLVVKSVKKLYNSNAFYHEQQKIIVSEKEITCSSESSCVKLTENKIKKICITDKAIYVYISTVQAYIITKQMVGNNDKYNEIANYIKDNFFQSKIIFE